ncbi:MAG TPA: hypothetical protein VED01_21250 [Burkholderiales bacterium]|nr:hypothetical protein [Burkholderiales bacterium]
MPRYGLLVAGFHYPNIAEDEFNDWYDTEHIPERMSVKGFINAQRWVAADGARTALATYDLESLAVLKQPSYTSKKGDGRTPWSKRIARTTELFCRLTAEQIVPGDEAAPSNAGGLLMFATNVAREAENDFNNWYNEEHVPALRKVAGVLSARRFKTDEGAPQYVALYHLSGPEVASSEAWKKAVETPWTARIRPHMKDVLRLAFKKYEEKRA